MSVFTTTEKKQAVERELTYRRRVYGRWVTEGRLTQKRADQQIKVFEEILADYVKAEQCERLI
jgi:hypothetical protein